MFVPKLITCLKSGYDLKTFLSDLFAGITVGLVALPLAMAFAIASGVTPDRGLYTAVVAGFIISVLGGSKVQIGGPTGAFVVIVYAVVQKFGYDGLALATFMAGLMLLMMGFLKLGGFIRFIPYPVITGFTTGIAIIILTSQIKDFFGLKIDNVPADFFEKVDILIKSAPSWNFYAFALALLSTVAIFLIRNLNSKLPAAIIVVVGGSLVSYFFNLPVETIGSKFGEISSSLPSPGFPEFSIELARQVFPSAITIALLGAIESLLSAVVADGMTGYRHRSNMELVAQGTANIASVMFGGIPATGAIARTATNVKSGAKTPVAGIIHAITLLLFMLFLAPLAKYIPLASLAAVLVVVSWYMSESHNFVYIFRASKADMAVLMTTLLLTVLVDLTVAVEVGMVLSAILFIKKMSDVASVSNISDNIRITSQARGKIQIYEINGPLFFGMVNKLTEIYNKLPKETKVCILRMEKVSSIDVTGLRALELFYARCKSSGITVMLSEFSEETMKALFKAGLRKKNTSKYHFKNFNKALNEAKKII